MKSFRKLGTRKGFTLVECVVAIAVFAVLTTMVMMILANTTTLTKEARDNEEDLNELVENVVEDKSPRKYGSDAKKLTLYKSGSTNPYITATFSVTDGKKNYFKCPTCGHTGGMADYLDYIYDTPTYKTSSDSEKKANNITYWFTAGTDTQKFVCPDCHSDILLTDTALKMHCNACLHEGFINNTDFKYMKNTAAIVCVECGSGNAISIDMMGNDDANVTNESAFSVSGFRANAVRYGTVQRKPFNELKQLITLTAAPDASVVSTFRVQISKLARAKATDPVIYEATISNIPSWTDANTIASLKLSLPGGYKCKITDYGNADGAGITSTPGSGNANVTVAVESPEDTSGTNDINVSNITKNNCVSIHFKFKLENSGNGSHFEDDYAAELAQYTADDSYYKGYDNSGTLPTATTDCALNIFWFAMRSDTLDIDMTNLRSELKDPDPPPESP